ncbi:DoxX-like family protein [Pseudomonas sp. 8AS]|uniref:DoxX-like family protein n=1 Tax=Pseudomonas sp. 8AS TaxID=2653163 RepID=UPI0012F2173E|nr:DoxX-like family protein [Pseudomonas sp. 8AS]VXC34120.1 DoxX-like family protein [Pseudomonas sp. 8AS]
MIEPRLQQIALLARVALALMFVWHGLVPKILWLSPDEVAMIQAHGFGAIEAIAQLAGLGEIALGLLLVLQRRRRWPLLLVAAVLLGLLLDVAWFSPHLLLQAFNPLSTNVAGLALCLLAWLAEKPLPGSPQPH